MTVTVSSDNRTIAELLTQLGRGVDGDSFAAGLTPAQWTALRYFARANRFSRTVSAFAEFHATTRGTASQTVKSLVTKGLLQRTRCPHDGRSGRLDITDQGLQYLADDPLESLVNAAAGLPDTLRNPLLTALEQLSLNVAQARRRRLFGCCGDCLYRCHACDVKTDANPIGDDYRCGLVDERLAHSELAQICANYKPRSAGCS